MAGTEDTVLHDLLGEIEALRFKRQEQITKNPDGQLKRFTQQELNDEVCPTYKNLLIGRSRRVPSREMVLRIADYLECNAAERNNLLLAGRYLPEALELEGPQLGQSLEQAQKLMETLSYPAMILTHRLEVYGVNEAFLHIFQIPAINVLPVSERHLFHFLFHPDFPTRIRSTFDTQALKVWQAQALRGIQLFQQSNVLYQFDPWYQDVIEHFSRLANFREFWEQASSYCDLNDGPSKLYLSKNAETGEPTVIQVRHIHISVNSHRYPGIAAFYPVDEAARSVFASLNR